MLRIGLLFPDLLGTYGDGGNALALQWRAQARGERVEVVTTSVGESLVDADIYLLGGGEDGPQRLAAEQLRASGFAQRLADGAHCLAVCAGLQILGTSFAVEGNDHYEGLGVVDAVTTRGETRAVGDMLISTAHGDAVGFENHGGRTSLGSGCTAMGRVRVGVGNDGDVDGYRHLNIIATYAHGPVLALNPWLADELLSAALGRGLEPLASVADDLYAARIAAMKGA